MNHALRRAMANAKMTETQLAEACEVGTSPQGENSGENTPHPAAADDADDGELAAAAGLLSRLGHEEPRLRLGASEATALAPLVAQWQAGGCSEPDLQTVLLAGLPSRIHSPMALLRYRLERKMPQLKPPAPERHECGKCRAPVARSGICRTCAGLAPPRPRVGGGEAATRHGAALARAALRGLAPA